MGIMTYLLTLAIALLLALRAHLLTTLTCYLYMDLSINLSTLKDILYVLYRETTPLHYVPLVLPLPPLFLFIYYL
jgi:hypothetical protein